MISLCMDQTLLFSLSNVILHEHVCVLIWLPNSQSPTNFILCFKRNCYALCPNWSDAKFQIAVIPLRQRVFECNIHSSYQHLIDINDANFNKICSIFYEIQTLKIWTVIPKFPIWKIVHKSTILYIRNHEKKNIRHTSVFCILNVLKVCHGLRGRTCRRLDCNCLALL